MPRSLADRLREVRQEHFVGRETEQTAFQSALLDAELPFSVLYIYGPGGVGKTTLLNRFAELCEQTQVPSIRLDGREIGASAQSFVQALGAAMGLDSPDGVVEVLAGVTSRHVILLDTYEQLAGLDPWLRDTFLPQLSVEVLIVVADRNPPAPGWRSDSAWQSLVRLLPLRNLTPQESRRYLNRRGVPGDAQGRVLSFTHGHPLALSLVADVFDQHLALQFDPEAVPNVIQLILDRLLDNVPSVTHRKALEACALVRAMTEPLLATMLNLPVASSEPGQATQGDAANAQNVHELFEWLRGLSFTEIGGDGLYLHELVCDALAADLRWRNPDNYAALHNQARAYYAQHIRQSGGGAQQGTGAMIDYVYLHRDNPVVRPFYEQMRSQGSGVRDYVSELPKPSDWRALEDMVAQHEGQEAAELARVWFKRQPAGVTVWRDRAGQPVGFMATLALDKAAPEDIERDPATRAACRYLQQHAPLRAGETASYFRFWITREDYQVLTSLQGLIFVSMALHYITTPGLAYSFLPCAESNFWAPLFGYADLARVPEADFELQNHCYGIYGHDWRSVPPLAWLDLLAARETARKPQSVQLATTGETLAVLSRPEFADAVLEALRSFVRSDRLRRNPLLQSRLVGADLGADADEARRVEALRARVRTACETLRGSPRQLKLYRALELTYLNPAPTQEVAAERLDVPFRTFRRHLQSGIAEVTEILWQQELGLL